MLFCNERNRSDQVQLDSNHSLASRQDMQIRLTHEFYSQLISQSVSERVNQSVSSQPVLIVSARDKVSMMAFAIIVINEYPDGFQDSVAFIAALIK